MIPTVSHQLGAIRHTIAKTIIPAIGPDERFAQEQAGLMLACLDWALDVQEHQHRYEQVEREDYRSLLSDLVGLGAEVDLGDAESYVSAAAQPPADLAGLRQQSRRLKSLVEEAFLSLADSPKASDARARVAATATRQSQRELAWCRMTGFPQWTGGHVSEVLDAQQ